VAKYPLGREYHILFEVGFLPDDPIHLGDYTEVYATFKDLWADQCRANGREVIKCLCVEKLPSRVFLDLEHAARQVISDCIAQDVVLGLCLGDIAACFRSHEHKLALGDTSCQFFLR